MEHEKTEKNSCKKNMKKCEEHEKTAALLRGGIYKGLYVRDGNRKDINETMAVKAHATHAARIAPWKVKRPTCADRRQKWMVQAIAAVKAHATHAARTAPLKVTRSACADQGNKKIV